MERINNDLPSITYEVGINNALVLIEAVELQWTLGQTALKLKD